MTYKKIKYIVIDVDGTMTDGGIYYDDRGNEFKKFCTRDAAGFFAARECGIKLIVLTGRECAATSRRMIELHVDVVKQGICNKLDYLCTYMQKNKIQRDEIAYIGDDLNDYECMRLVGFVGCPSDAAQEIKEIANYIANQKGGGGAVRDVISYLLKERGEWDEATRKCYGIGL